MEKIAFIIGGTFLYWSDIILIFSELTAMLLFLALYLGKSGKAVAAFLAVPMSLMASLVLARLVHWYCRSDAYESFAAAMTQRSGDYALAGVFAGCFLSACLLRVLRLHKNLPQMLDCMSLAGSAGIAVGRLGSLFNNSDRGMALEGITELPLAYPVVEPVSGAVSYRLATFMLQAIAAGTIFAVLTLFFLFPRWRKKLRHGDTALLFLLCYGASQILLDSTRYDSLFLRSNGFVGLVQILGAAAVVLAIVVFSVRLVKSRGWKVWYLLLWLPIAAALGSAGYMEYYVQRHGNQAQFAYSIMGACLAAVVLLTFVIRLLANRKAGDVSTLTTGAYTDIISR